ncbi:MAG: hypothetical protein LBC64_08400 [Fibromonadaceae bacterium]|jgi:uncharacterized protein (TIGR02145 family)|nr:hypothetical protein [Fibromonadaceae bacterium]
MRKIITKAIALLITFSTVTLAQQKGTFTDARDKKTYKTVKIGEQVWMAENLNYADKDSKCYDDNEENCKKYGRLYNWETAIKACPAGWHLPRKAEWERLLRFADSTYTGKESEIAGNRLRAKSGWQRINGEPNNGTDTYGFSALPGGGFMGRFAGIGGTSALWSATENPDPKSKKKVTAITFTDNRVASKIDSAANDVRVQFSVRCIQGSEAEFEKAEAETIAKEKAEAEAKSAKEKSEAEAYVKANGGTFTDTRDKKTYKTIKINGQTWLAENLNYAAENTKCYDDKPENCTQYGRLYNWETAMKSCPAGWHLPKNEEWNKLYHSADGTSGTESYYESKTAGKFLKAANGWADNNGKSGNGVDKFGFSALPGGAMRNFNNSNIFGGVGSQGLWWSANFVTIMTNGGEYAKYDASLGKNTLISVRCIKD